MNYSEYHSGSKRKGNAVFYMILACCLLAVGAAAWFAARNMKQPDPKIEESSSLPSSSAPSMPSEPSAIETPSGDVTESVDNSVSNVPYTPSESEQAAEAKAKTKEKIFSMPVEGEVVKTYNENELQYSSTYGDMRLHLGVDISCEDGAAISAVAAGAVTSIEENATFGTVVTIDHGEGLVTQYAALKDLTVHEGDAVSAGDVIGCVTSIPSECADQSHLHFALLKNGHFADPTTLF